jgi:hypothetical protein
VRKKENDAGVYISFQVIIHNNEFYQAAAYYLLPWTKSEKQLKKNLLQLNVSSIFSF